MNINEISKLRPITRILVTGGAGSVGQEVLKELLQHKKWYQVKVLEQNTPSVLRKLKPFRKDFQLVLGDLCNPEVLEKASADIDFVIHLAAIIPPLADRLPLKAERINVEGTRALVNAVQRNSPYAFFLYTSSISVYGDRLYNPWITVDDPLLPSEGDEYAQTKVRAEKIVMRSRLKSSVFRLSAIMGPQTRFDPLFFHMPLETSLEIATARDTGFALVEAIYHQDEIRGKVFNLSGGEKCRTLYRDFLTRVFRIKGLQELNFPEEAFAHKNFHCGNYADTGELEEILHFQQDSLEDYYRMLENKGTSFSKKFNKLFSPVIKKFLLMRSEPFRASKRNNSQYLRSFKRQVPQTAG